ncbi:MAG TPA: hypothetical protein VL093_14640 [Flavipsychrobacter sp.]|nr:hypothetical protein [Flavipsychrobacter sp.]
MRCDHNTNTRSPGEDTTTKGSSTQKGQEAMSTKPSGSDTAAIHENTSTPGVRDKDAGDTLGHPYVSKKMR